MSDHPQHHTSEYAVTRAHLEQGTLLRALRANTPAGMTVRSDEELEQTLRATLDLHAPGADLHIFGYGSLMWNPAFEAADARAARINGWHRRFCLELIAGRGTPEQPGAMLALDRGGACNGIAYRIEADKIEAELKLLWRREMVSDSYHPKWVWAMADGRRVRALTFVANREHGRYLCERAPDYVAHLIRTGSGSLGTSRAYFDATVHALARLGVRDAGIERLRRTILEADAAAA
jgi:glutathione-specific gamma-glutamylcyclotransferase